MVEIIRQYINRISKIFSTKEATEHSYRGEFKNLCERVLNGASSKSIDYSELKKNNAERYTLINEPKRKTYGAPD